MICIWLADATATPSSLASAKSRMVILLVLAYPGCPGKKAVKRLCVCVCACACVCVCCYVRLC